VGREKREEGDAGGRRKEGDQSALPIQKSFLRHCSKRRAMWLMPSI